MSDPFVLGCVAIVLALTAGYVSMVARQKVHDAREAEMRDAVGLLRVHCDAMQRLDDDATPESVLAFALKLSAFLHEPGTREIAVRVLKANGPISLPSEDDMPSEADTMVEDYKHLLGSRPDLATAFMQVIVAGILSFERRFPECAGALTPHVARLVTSPIEEAQRIVKAADQSPRPWGASEPAPLAA